VATVDAAVVTAIVVLVGLAVEAPTADAVAAGGVAFLVAWGALFSLQRLILRVLRHAGARIPTPPDEPERAGVEDSLPDEDRAPRQRPRRVGPALGLAGRLGGKPLQERVER
jgi:hypothetical protein